MLRIGQGVSMDPRLTRVSQRQGGAFTVAQAVACGYTRGAIRHRVASGRWTAARYGVQADEVGETAEVMATRAAVQALPMREREAIIWRFYLGCSVRETAAGLGCPEGTVKTLVYRAINRLREAGLVEEAFDG